MSMIQFNQVTFGYQDEPIIRDLSLNVEPNTFWAVIGPNGSGKSTLLNLLCGLLKPRQGTITVNGTPISQYAPRKQALMMSLVRQEFVPAFEYTVSEIVMMARYSRRKQTLFESEEDRRVVKLALEATDTLEFSDRTLVALSGGERQRVFIARALAQETPILLLDEPTSHLDVKHQIRIFDLLKEMQHQQSKTILIVTHDLNLACQYADNVILMGPSCQSIQGTPSQIINSEHIKSYFEVNGYHGTLQNEKFFIPLGRFSKDSPQE